MIAYVRIPKTASCTILKAVGSQVVSKDHEPIEFYTGAAATFTFVRNPWERLHSWYRHAGYFQHRSFEEYVTGEETHPMHPVAPTQRYRHGNANETDMLVADQADWFRYRQPTFIGRFENLAQDLVCIGDMLGFNVKAVPHENRNTRMGPETYSPDLWTPKMLEIMAPIFEPFAEQFGYESP